MVTAWEGPCDEWGQRKSVGMPVAGCCRPTLAAIADVVWAAESFQMEKTLKKNCLQVQSVKHDVSLRLIVDKGVPSLRHGPGKNRPR